jgi:zinc protease
LRVAEAILSTGKSSRLYRRLVDGDKSVTSANAVYHDHIDPSLFYFQAELKPGFRLEQVEHAVYDEIERLKQADMSSAELAKAKRLIEADLVLSNEEPLQQAMLLGQYETIAFGERIPEDSRGFRYLETMLGRIDAVTLDDVARSAQKYFTEDNRTVGYLNDDASNHETAVKEKEHNSGS